MIRPPRSPSTTPAPWPGCWAALREAGAQEQAAALAGRAAAQVPLDDPGAVARLLDALREAGAEEQAAALAGRAAAHVPLDHPGAVAGLLDELREAGAQEQATALLRRDPAAHVALDYPDDVAWLLDELREAGAQEHAAALADRLPGAGMFEVFREQQNRRDQFPFGREVDGSPAKPWDWEIWIDGAELNKAAAAKDAAMERTLGDVADKLLGRLLRGPRADADPAVKAPITDPAMGAAADNLDEEDHHLVKHSGL